MSGLSDPDRTDPYSSQPGAGATAVLDRQVQEQSAEPGDHDRFAHYVRKDKIMQATLGGTPVIALCGKVWVPGRDPEKYPVCPECKEVYEGLRDPADGDGDNSGGSGGGSKKGGFGRFFGR